MIKHAFALLAVVATASAQKPLFKSAVINEATPGHAVAVDVKLPEGAKQLHLVVTDGGNGYGADWADWVEPKLVFADGTSKKLTDLKWKSASADWGQVRVGQNAGGGPLSVNGVPAKFGIGTHANSHIAYDLPPGATRFTTKAALDNGGTDQGGSTSVQFLVFAENPKDFVAKNRRRSTAGNASASHDPSEAVSQLEVHADLEATLFASEPHLLSPSAIDIDHRGRVWVCEVVNYRRHKGKRPEGDRILIVEDTDGDNLADKTTTFYQGNDVDSAHGITVLGNRVIVSAGDDVFSLFDDDGDDKADRKELLFTKIGGAQHDHGIHAFHFGPDGKFYFNFGNTGQRLCDKDGNLVTDRAGNTVERHRKPYQEGMIFRCNPDGSDVETLAWNFRNNWEAAVDSFGAIWQSDNDDDGNRGVRINYVIPYGNYGYKDERTGAGWRDARPNIETEIPLRHWHLNDPGVVPNLIQTGAGSPTGIVVYEGELLPRVFHGQPIHCDAGPNVVRAYPVTQKGAGYEASMLPVLTGTQNRWFRPSDVCVAPDGSLIVADWYDPGVGGHGMGDLERGRLFLVAPPEHSYHVPEHDFASLEGAIETLKSPNMATRYLAYQAIAGAPAEKRDPALRAAFLDTATKPYLRARYFHAAVSLAGESLRQMTIVTGLRDPEPRIRMAAVRATRYAKRNLDLIKQLNLVAEDADPRVRAEAAASLRFAAYPDADALWTKLAQAYPGDDRWYLEALGIGADLFWDNRFNAYLEATGDKPDTDIVWRSRSSKTAALLGGSPRDIRAFHFLPDSEEKTAALQKLFKSAPADTAYVVATTYLGGNQADDGRLRQVADAHKGKPELVKLVTRFGLDGYDTDLLAFISANPNDRAAADAARYLLPRDGIIAKTLAEQLDPGLISALGRTGDKRALPHLTRTLYRTQEAALVRTAIEALAATRDGENELLRIAEKGELPDHAKFTTAAILGRSRDSKIRDAIAAALDLPPAPGTEKFPPVPELVRMRGNAGKGQAAYQKATCATCHVVKGEGLNFGPDLSEIGNKLPAEAMVEAILYPSNAVAHGYTGHTVTTRGGEVLVGLIDSETDDAITLRLPGGITRTLKPADIAKREELPTSLMPQGLAAILSTQEFADLLTYLTSLR